MPLACPPFFLGPGTPRSLTMAFSRRFLACRALGVPSEQGPLLSRLSGNKQGTALNLSPEKPSPTVWDRALARCPRGSQAEIPEKQPVLILVLTFQVSPFPTVQGRKPFRFFALLIRWKKISRRFYIFPFSKRKSVARFQLRFDQN